MGYTATAKPKYDGVEIVLKDEAGVERPPIIFPNDSLGNRDRELAELVAKAFATKPVDVAVESGRIKFDGEQPGVPFDDSLGGLERDVAIAKAVADALGTHSP